MSWQLKDFPSECVPDVIHVGMSMNDHDSSDFSPPSQLFTVRVWLESKHDENIRLRIQVKHVLSGAMRSYREWPKVVAFIEEMLQDSEVNSSGQSD